MNKSILNKLESINDRYKELKKLLETPDNIHKFRIYSIEYAKVSSIVDKYNEYNQIKSELESAKYLLQDIDQELHTLAEEEVSKLSSKLSCLSDRLKIMLFPQDTDDCRNVFLEIRAATGGNEASLFCADLCRMYFRYAERQGWKIEILSVNESEYGGYKEVIVRVDGYHVYSKLKFESGGHRVQRVPETESQGRIHTSTCTVAVLPEHNQQTDFEIKGAHLRIDTYRSSGAGGQHVNKTDSAVRITHIPSGIVIECQEDRSQHKNRARAMSILAAKLKALQKETERKKIANKRKLLVGSGDKSERIRTYNFPKGRITDHRINLTLYSLYQVLDGMMDKIIDKLLQENQKSN